LERFRDAIEQGRFALTAELTLKRESTADDVRRQADLLAPYVDAIEVSDNPYAWVQMSSVAAAAILLDHGADPLPLLTCRDRNRTALMADLNGLLALGASSVLVMRGHRVPQAHVVPASTVFDITGRELISLAASLSADAPGADEAALLVGTGARAFRPRRGWRAESLGARVTAGAGFVQTQLCFNPELLKHYVTRLSEAGLEHPPPVITTLSPLPSARTARWLKENVSDSRIPAALINRLDESADPQREGIAICAELMREISAIEGIAGIHLMTMGDPESIPEAIEASGLRDAA
jgi:methylenetetrahydrofolate reductase (NADPH)